jgi:hypothetical protein
MRWIDAPQAELTFTLPDLNPLVSGIILRRGFSTRRDIQAFLDPDSYSAHRGREIPGMAIAAERIESAVEMK